MSFDSRVLGLAPLLEPRQDPNDVQRLRHLAVAVRDDQELADSLAQPSGAESPSDLGLRIWVAGQLRCTAAVPALLRLLEDASQASDVRAESATALEHIGDPAVFHRLVSVGSNVTNPQLVRMRAILSAARLGDDPDDAAFATLLADKSDAGPVRAIAAEALSYTAGPVARSALRNELAGLDPEVRFWSIHSLGEIGQPEDIAFIEPFLADRAEVAGYNTIADEASSAIDAIRHRSRG